MGTYNWKKMNIASGKWTELPMAERQLTKRAEAAYDWLMTNETYASWQLAAMTAGPHKDHGYVFQTWNLLHSPGIEVAAFPLLYPQSSFGDTNLKDRLVEKNWIGANAKPFIGFSYLKKITSPCMSYANEPKLMFLLHDVKMAKQIMLKVSLAEKQNVTPDVLTQRMTNSEAYCRHEQLEDELARPVARELHPP